MNNCNWPESGPCSCYMANVDKPDPYGRIWMHCEEGLCLSKASMSRFIMFCLLNNVDIGSIYPFDYRHRNSQVSATVKLKPEQFEAFEVETHGELRKPPRISLNSSNASTIESKENVVSEYTRTDVADARIKKLEALLLRAEDTIGKSWVTIYPDMEEEFNTDGSWHVVQDIRAALKGEKT